MSKCVSSESQQNQQLNNFRVEDLTTPVSLRNTSHYEIKNGREYNFMLTSVILFVNLDSWLPKFQFTN